MQLGWFLNLIIISKHEIKSTICMPPWKCIILCLQNRLKFLLWAVWYFNKFQLFFIHGLLIFKQCCYQSWNYLKLPKPIFRKGEQIGKKSVLFMPEHPEKTRLFNKDKVRELRYLKRALFTGKEQKYGGLQRKLYAESVVKAMVGSVCFFFWGCFSFYLFLFMCMGMPAFLYMSMCMQVPKEAREKGEILWTGVTNSGKRTFGCGCWKLLSDPL